MTEPADDKATDTDMTATYIRVVIVEAVVLTLLWLLGRAFS